MAVNNLVLVTGGTGYVGGRLVNRLIDRGENLRLIARRPEYLRSRVPADVDVIAADVTKPESLQPALNGVKTAYYLIHSMGAGEGFESRDRDAARNFATAAKAAGVSRIIYLGGLGDESADLSEHLRSRHEVGEVLKESEAQVIEFRASIIIGSGSLSFELIRSLVRKLPVMICPRWVSTPAQPIAIDDVLDYLVAALDRPPGASKIYEIGGPDKVSYAGLVQEFARQRGLKRWMLPVPFLSPYLSSLWLGLVTPVYARIGRQLIEGLRNPTVVTNPDASQDFEIQPLGLTAAIERALANEDQEFAETHWHDSVSSGRSGQSTSPSSRYGGEAKGSRLIDCRKIVVDVPPDQAFEPIRRIGGTNGWYFGTFLWRIRGFLDLLVGGVGFRRGRRHPTDLRVGDALDFWRVEEFDPPRDLRLKAEMRLPGRAWLKFEVTPHDGGSEITQTAIFDPYGLLGLLYWYGIYPLHVIVFRGMLRGLKRAAETGPLPAERD